VGLGNKKALVPSDFDEYGIAKQWWAMALALSPIWDLLNSSSIDAGKQRVDVEVEPLLSRIPELKIATNNELSFAVCHTDGGFLRSYLREIASFLESTEHALRALHPPEGHEMQQVLIDLQRLWNEGREECWPPILIVETHNKHAVQVKSFKQESFQISDSVESIWKRAKMVVCQGLYAAVPTLDKHELCKSLGIESFLKLGGLQANLLSEQSQSEAPIGHPSTEYKSKVRESEKPAKSRFAMAVEISRGLPNIACLSSLLMAEEGVAKTDEILRWMTNIWNAAKGHQHTAALKSIVELLYQHLEQNHCAPRIVVSNGSLRYNLTLHANYSSEMMRGCQTVDFRSNTVTVGISQFVDDGLLGPLVKILNADDKQLGLSKAGDYGSILKELRERVVKNEDIHRSQERIKQWLISNDGITSLRKMRDSVESFDFPELILKFVGASIYPPPWIDAILTPQSPLGRQLVFTSSNETPGLVLSVDRYSLSPEEAVAEISLGAESNLTNAIKGMACLMGDEFIDELRLKSIRHCLFSEAIDKAKYASDIPKYLTSLLSASRPELNLAQNVLQDWCRHFALEITPSNWELSQLVTSDFSVDDPLGAFEFAFDSTEKKLGKLQAFGCSDAEVNTAKKSIYERYRVLVSVGLEPRGYQALRKYLASSYPEAKLNIDDLPQKVYEQKEKLKLTSIYMDLYRTHAGELPSEAKQSLEAMLGHFGYRLDSEVTIHDDGIIEMDNSSDRGEFRLLRPALYLGDRLIMKAKGTRTQ
jgi:hypothetical protein